MFKHGSKIVSGILLSGGVDVSQEHIGTRNFVQIGLFGGLFWGGIWYFLHIFSFTEAGPNYLLLPFAFEVGKKGYGEMCQELFVWDYFRF